MFSTAFQANAFQTNAFQIYIPPTPDNFDTHDGFTPEEIRRARELDRRIAAQQRKLEESIKQQNLDRKNAIRNLVDPKPVAKIKKSKVESKSKVKADIPSVDTEALERHISNLEKQRDNLLRIGAYKQEAARLQAYLGVLEAQRLAELDDEETILTLM